jgi:LL-diaminopimelate aminotransferase
MDMFPAGIFSELAELRKGLESRGVRVIDLGVGTPNLPPEPHIVEALEKAVKDSSNYIYAINDLPELREAVAQWYLNRYETELCPNSEIISLNGSQDGLAHLALTLVDPGDTVLVPEPCYPIFEQGALLAGANVSHMPLRRENGYIIDFNDIDPKVAAKTKLMVVSYPNNPTAAVAPPAFYQELIEFATKYGIAVLHDNAYSELAFDGRKCGSFLAYPGAKQIGIEFNSLSKTYGIAGCRIGFALGNRDIIKNLATLKSNIDYGVFLPIQKAAIAAVTGPQDGVGRTREAYRRRRDLLVDGLADIGWHIEKPAGTMFVWAKLPKGYLSSRDFVMNLMERAGVVMVPGSCFGKLGEGNVRIALVQDEKDILEAISRIKESGIINK